MQNLVTISIFISSNLVVEGSKSDNLTKAIMKVLMIGGDLWKNQIAHKFTCFGVDGVNVFQGSKNGV